MEISRPTFGGLASGLDTNALLNGLLELERIPLNRLQSRRSEVDSQRGLMRDLNTKLLELRKAAQALDNRNDADSAVASEEEFLRYSGASTDEDIVDVSAGAGAAPGDIQIEVISLARGSRRFSYTYSDRAATALTSGQFIDITLPNGDPTATPAVEDTNIRVQAEAGTSLSLEDVRDQINTSEDNGGTVRADILQISDDEFKLVLTTTGTGESNQLAVTGNLVFENQDARDRATNAQVRLFGQVGDAVDPRIIERESNSIDDILDGITFRLKRESAIDQDAANYDPNAIAGSPEYLAQSRKAETLSVEIDVDAVAKGLERFTKAYNDVVSFIDRQFRYDETNKTSGPLAGDSTLRFVQSELRGMISRGFLFADNPSNPFAPGTNGSQGGTITGIGIDIQSGGTLSVDKEKLEEALTRDPTSLREFLSGRTREGVGGAEDTYDSGFAQLFATRLEELVRSGDGTLANRDDAFQRRLDQFDESISRFEFRIGQREETLIRRFSELERIVSGLQNQQGFLSSLG